MKRISEFLLSSVRGRLLFLVLAITAPAVLLVGLMALQAYRNERQSAAQHLTATARAISSLVDQQVAYSEALLKGLATSRDLAAGDYAAFYARAQSVVEGPERWIVLADETGQQLANTRLAFGAPLPRHPLEGDYVAVITQGRTYVSNITMGTTIKRHILYVVVPVMENGRIKYTLSYVMFPSALANTLRPDRVSPGTVVSIIDRNGVIVARHPNGDRFVGGPATPDVVATTVAGREGNFESVTLEGHRVLAIVSRAPISGWSVVIGVPYATLYASAERLLWVGLAIAALLIAVTIVIARWIGRALVRGVDALVADTNTVGRGGVPTARSNGLVETDLVAEAVRRTALRLSERDRENAALTAALQGELEKQKRAEENNRRLAAIVESSDDAIISQNLDGIIASWNRGAERIFGYTAAEIIGRSITLLIPPNRHVEGLAILERIRDGQSIEHFETVRCRKDGRIIPVSVTLSPLRNHEGKIVGASKICRDVSQRQRAESQQQALFELVARVNRAEALPEIYDAALDAMQRCIDADRAAILLCDAAGVMRFTASRHLSETYRSAVEGHSPWQASDTNPQPVWIDDLQHASLVEPLRDAIRAEGVRALAFVPLTYEKRLLGKFMVYFNAPHRFSTYELRPVQTIASQVAFAIERRRGAEALEALVSKRTASLQQVIAQMEEFSYSVSHDLRAPVRAMRGYASIILQDHGWRLEREARELLVRVERNGARMDRMIHDLLTYTTVSRREIELEPVSLDKLIREVVQQYPDMRPECADIDVEGPLPDVIAHEPSLTQVVSNLLSNAVKFVPPNERPRIRVGCDRRDFRARLWVADNGIGIKPEHQARLFGMFERIHPDQKYEGTGIGLAIVRKALERMNGVVGVESDGVSGSTFWFELPIAVTVEGGAA
jgi:PAS domain S-box-containing protein